MYAKVKAWVMFTEDTNQYTSLCLLEWRLIFPPEDFCSCSPTNWFHYKSDELDHLNADRNKFVSHLWLVDSSLLTSWSDICPSTTAISRLESSPWPFQNLADLYPGLGRSCLTETSSDVWISKTTKLSWQFHVVPSWIQRWSCSHRTWLAFEMQKSKASIPLF